VRVFNLTPQSLVYRGRSIPPYGSEEIAVAFIPNRDLALQKAGVLSFGSLPNGWKPPEPKPEPLQQAATLLKEFIKAELAAPGILREAFPAEEVQIADKLDTSFKKKK